MSWGRALALLIALPACDGCDSEPTAADLGGATTASVRATESAAPESPEGRAAAHARAVPEARERAARRAVLLSDGRRLSREGRHAEAIRAFEDALADDEGSDAVLRCEAGSEAIQLGQWPLARRHLRAGLSVAIQPRRRATCLNQLALVEEQADDRGAAAAALRESLSLRPNAAVERRLRALEADADEEADEEEADAEEAVQPTLEALCADPCQPLALDLPALPEGWPSMAFIARPDPPLTATWLAAEDSDGWRAVARVAREDPRDTYGALEAAESVAGARVEDGALVVSVAGVVDEAPGEAAAFFDCEERHRGNEGAAMRCFGAAAAELPPPESWSFELVFVLEDERVVLRERRAHSETHVDPDAPLRAPAR